MHGYETLWKKEFGSAIEKGMFFRELYKGLDNKSVDEIFRSVDFLGMSEVDMDNPFTVLGD